MKARQATLSVEPAAAQQVLQPALLSALWAVP
jgi:hypothetical protein